METKHRLPKEFAEKWIAALRSGEYKQGKAVLYSDGRYCCLGVAAELCGHDPKKEGGTYLFPHRYPNSPKEIQQSTDLSTVLTDFNDSGRSFDEIADWIEQNVELY